MSEQRAAVALETADHLKLTASSKLAYVNGMVCAGEASDPTSCTDIMDLSVTELELV